MLHTLRGISSPRNDREPSDPVLRSMFEARKAVFVDLLNWDVSVLGGRYEADQFDDIHATYLVVSDPNNCHLASARLLPTTRPHILGSLYSTLCDEPPPQRPDVLEITRFCLDRRLRATARRAARDALVRQIVTFALENDITAYTAVAEMAWFKQILAFGWCCRPLGIPQRRDGQVLAALLISIDQETPSRLAAAGIGDAGYAPALSAAA